MAEDGKPENKLICDGCNVRPPWEHRCHEGNAWVRGEKTGRPCQCDECKP